LNSINTSRPPRKLFLTIEGLIGIGKSTLAKYLAKELNYNLYLEPIDDDVKYVRELFYADMKTWAFAFQVKLFQKRFRQHQLAIGQRPEHGAVQDRSIYGDKVFAYVLHDMGYINDEMLQIYEETWDTMKQFIVNPDLMIFLEAPTQMVLDRIKKDRQRPEELEITLDYLQRLENYTETFRIDMQRHGVTCWTCDWIDPNLRLNLLIKDIKREEIRNTSLWGRTAP
jgi:deoxyadenosine/deoxycytidine kinase